MSPETLSKVKRLIHRFLCPPRERFILSFFGGEPLMQFADVCKPLIEYTYNTCVEQDIEFQVLFTTNCGLLTDNMIDFLASKRCGMQITLDGGKEFHDRVRFFKDKSGSYDLILSNIKKLNKAGINIVLRINYTKGNLKSLNGIVNDIVKLNLPNKDLINVDFQRVWQDREGEFDDFIDASIEQISNKLRQKGIHVSNHHLENIGLYSCYGDKKNHYVINYNGDFYKCTARDFNRKNRYGVLAEDGTLIWDDGQEQTWLEAKFKFKVCRNCRIAPICLGGCRQRERERLDNGQCPLDRSEEDINQKILWRFYCRHVAN